MATLPAFYIDNVSLTRSDTVYVRGNRVTNLSGKDVTGIEATNCDNLRMKNNSTIRINSTTGTSTGIKVSDTLDALLIYHTAARTQLGLDLDSTVLDVYNVTTHNCSTGITSQSGGDFYNIAMSAGKDHYTYKNSYGIESVSGTVNLDYAIYYQLADLEEPGSAGSFSLGDTISDQRLIYFDPDNDNYTPDHISTAVNTGTANPVKSTAVDISGIESLITNEISVSDNFFYDLFDNDFWDSSSELLPQISFWRALQSRAAANSELAAYEVERMYYIKMANTLDRYGSVFPATSQYINQEQYRRRLMDLWWGTFNPATVQSYQNGIGGYNLLPTFITRAEDLQNSWVIGVSYVNYNNWILGTEAQKYGIALDVLGTSTMTLQTSAEMFKNVNECIADMAPIKWFMHEEAQPSGYTLFTDLYNGFELCDLTNMVYDDQYCISVETVGSSGEVITPVIPTDTTLSTSVSGDVEVSLLDRRYSEVIDRSFYYRQADNPNLISGYTWTEINKPIGGYLTIDSDYVQFKLEVSGVIRTIDYSFMGLCMRPYNPLRTGRS